MWWSPNSLPTQGNDQREKNVIEEIIYAPELTWDAYNSLTAVEAPWESYVNSEAYELSDQELEEINEKNRKKEEKEFLESVIYSDELTWDAYNSLSASQAPWTPYKRREITLEIEQKTPSETVEKEKLDWPKWALDKDKEDAIIIWLSPMGNVMTIEKTVKDTSSEIPWATKKIQLQISHITHKEEKEDPVY